MKAGVIPAFFHRKENDMIKKEWIDVFELDFFQLRFYEKLGNLFRYKSDAIEIPHNFETYLRIYGSIGYDIKRKKWCVGWTNGERDDLGNPKIYCAHDLATNVSSWNAKVGEEVILCYNNSLHASDSPIIDWYCELLKQCDISIKYQVINSRLIPILAVTDDRMKKECESLFENLKAGKPCIITTDILNDIKAIDIIDNANIEKMQYLTSFNESLNKRLFNEFGIDIDIKDKRAQVNSQELKAFEDVNTLNYLSYYEERMDFCKRMTDAGFPIDCIPSPVYADEPNQEEIENPEKAREFMLEKEEPAPEESKSAEETEIRKEGE